MEANIESPSGGARQAATSGTGKWRSVGLSSSARRVMAAARWYHAALAGVLMLSALLGVFRLGREGYSNLYYAATVKSMLTSWHNFFFASYDPGGFVSVDKPPLGLWIQTLSAWLFGFHGWSLLLPQVLAGVLSVALLYHLVRRTFGPVAGLIAALALAVAPINVATNRNNTMDSMLVLTLLIAAWAAIRAAESGRLRWLLYCAFMVGIGFNIKMLQAYLVLPAFGVLYLLAASPRWWRRVLHLGLATVVLVVVSLSWAFAVELTPADKRPYVGSSSNNSVLDLIFGYNGLNRLSGELGNIQQVPLTGAPRRPIPGQPQQLPPGFQPGQGPIVPQQGHTDAQGGGGPARITSIGGEAGNRGPLRLLNEQLAGQVGWLLPLAVLGLVAAAWQTRLRWPLDKRHQSLLLWGMWLLTQATFFSVAGFWHRYYLVVLSPAIAALAGAGVVAMWHDYRQHRWRGWLLPAALVGMAALQAYILADYPDWSRRLTPWILGLTVLATVGLVVARVAPRLRIGPWPAAAATAGVLALLIAPTSWGALTVWNAPGDMLPAAGPSVFEDMPGFPGGTYNVKITGGDATADPKLVSYLRVNRGKSKYLVATGSSATASPIILSTGEPVMALGGFGGMDPILTVEELAEIVARGEVRFFLLQSGMGPPQPSGSNIQNGNLPGPPENDRDRWVTEHCRRVPEESWQSATSSSGNVGPGGLGGEALYDCGAGAQ